MAHPPQRPQKVSDPQLILRLVFVTFVVWLLRGYVWPTLSNAEVDVLRAKLDPNLFRQDFFVQENLEFTPRYYFNALVSAPSKAGLSLHWTFALWHLAGIATLISGIRALSQTLKLGELATAVLTVWLLTITVGSVGGVYFYTHAPVPAVWAGALLPWGTAWAWRGRWATAFGFFGAAVLLQFLVGFYAGLLAIPALLWQRGIGGLRSTAFWLVAIAMIYGPMIWVGTTGSAAMDDSTFVEIYAFLRHPHHLVPSSWPASDCLNAALFYIGGFFFICRQIDGNDAGHRRFLSVAISLAGIGLFVNYLLIEVIPVSVVAKLQPARLTPLVQGIALVLLAIRLGTFARRRDWMAVALVTIAPFAPQAGLLLTIAALLLPQKTSLVDAPWRFLGLTVMTLLALEPFASAALARGFRLSLWCGLIVALLVPSILVNRQRWLACLTALTVICASTAAIISTKDYWPGFLRQRFSINAAPLDALARLGARFKLASAPDALVLVPPTEECWSFKLYSERAAVVDDKNSPFTEQGLWTWSQRMREITNNQIRLGYDSAAAWQSLTTDAIEQIASHHGAHYVLTRDRWHRGLKGRVVMRELDWTVWKLDDPLQPRMN